MSRELVLALLLGLDSMLNTQPPLDTNVLCLLHVLDHPPRFLFDSDDVHHELLLTLLLALDLIPNTETPVTPTDSNFLIFHLLHLLDHPPLYNPRFLLFDPEDIQHGRDVFHDISTRRMMFYDLSGETPETFLALFVQISPRFRPIERNRAPISLNRMNSLLLTLIWLKSYPRYSLLAALFNISYRQVSRIVNRVWPILYNLLSSDVSWPSHTEWLSKRENWPELPDAVGAIDGTSHEIVMPSNEPHRLYYSGYRRYHCLHTQVVIDNTMNIVYVQSGFLGHYNDAQTYSMMRPIGYGQQLHLPRNCYLLGDCIYPSINPLSTPYTANQLNNQPVHIRRRRRKVNEVIRKYRVRIEHIINLL